MVFRLLGEDTAKAYPFSRPEASGHGAGPGEGVGERTLSFELIE